MKNNMIEKFKTPLTGHQCSEFQKRIQEIQKKRKRDWDALSPAQRFAYEQKEMELSQGAQALELTQQSINQAASAQFQNTLLQQQQINAYQQRTRAMNEPVNVNLKGNINHTFDPVYTPPLRTPFSGY